tara:strand:+ start:4458 stop:4811 length:354 start_codon:yes stop_codon:yes gene_type:complete
MGFKLGKEKRKARTPDNSVPIYRKNLDPGVLGEANNDGTIFVDKSLKPGSSKYKEVVSHEMVHAKEMKEGKLDYGDDWIRYNNKTYPRKNGKIKYNGKWTDEGDKSFPWEKSAYKKQ